MKRSSVSRHLVALKFALRQIHRFEKRNAGKADWILTVGELRTILNKMPARALIVVPIVAKGYASATHVSVTTPARSLVTGKDHYLCMISAFDSEKPPMSELLAEFSK